jgi:hypothetical protein
MRSIVLKYVILHNKIVELRRDGYTGGTGDSFLFEPSGATSINLIPKARTVQERISQWQAAAQVESTSLPKYLRLALMRHIWKSKNQTPAESI